MSKVNPLYIALLLVIFLGFSLFKLSHAKEELHSAQEEISSVEEMAVKLSALKKTYGDDKRNKQSFSKLVKTLQSKGVKVDLKESRTLSTLSIMEIELKELDFFVNKLLNASYVIKTFKIEKANEKQARMHLEIQW